MSHVEAASSLFGSGDVDSDPFGAVIGEESFAVLSAASPLNSTDTGHESTYSSSQGYLGPDSYAAPAESHAQASDTYRGQEVDYNSQGWYDEYGQWHYYESAQTGPSPANAPSNSYNPYQPSNGPTSNSAYPTSPSALNAYETTASRSNSSYSTSNSYNPYGSGTVPQGTSTYSERTLPSSGVSFAEPSSIQTVSHDPYKPSAPTANAYPTPTTAHSRPLSSSSYSTYSPSSRLSETGSHYMMYGPPGSSEPPPPKPVVRPAVANAYDPPALITRSSQRNRTTSQQSLLTPRPLSTGRTKSGHFGGSQPSTHLTPHQVSDAGVQQPLPAVSILGKRTTESPYPYDGWPREQTTMSNVSETFTMKTSESLLERSSSSVEVQVAPTGNTFEGKQGGLVSSLPSDQEVLRTQFEAATIYASPFPDFPGPPGPPDSSLAESPASIPLPPSRTLSPASERAKSPVSVYGAYNEEITYQPLHTELSEPLTAKPSNGAQLYDPYRPVRHDSHMGPDSLERSTSPSGYSARSLEDNGPNPVAVNPYLPSAVGTASNVVIARSRSVSNSSEMSALGGTDPYAPVRYPSRQASEISDYASYTPSNNYTPSMTQTNQDVASTPSYSPVHEVSFAPTYAPYVPSPSLSGVNDPLGRARARIPLIHFGWGGKVVTCFHTSPTLETGFDVAMTSRHSTDVLVRPLHTLIPRSALETSEAEYPGPLFSDPGTPTAVLVRTGAAAQTKNKKARVIKYLEERANELSQGLGYFSHLSPELRRAEGKLALVKLLKVMVENDGRVSGSPSMETAVSVALVPRLESGTHSTTQDNHMVGFTSVIGRPEADDGPLVTYSLRSSNLDKIQDFLLRGQTREAYHYALDENLWAHAMVIASSVDKAAWKEVVQEFIQCELAFPEPKATSSVPPSQPFLRPSGRESLRVLYGLFSGQGSQSVLQLAPKQSLGRSDPLQQTGQGQFTPMSPRFHQTAPTVPAESLIKWNETAAAIYCSHMTSDAAAALTSLGDLLIGNDFVEAAHVCYLLSPQTSPTGGIGTPSVRISLLGSSSTSCSFGRDPDSFIFSEIQEFALSLSTPTKGQEPFPGLPHLQPYRFVRAMHLIELGHVAAANRYCEAIVASTTRAHAYFTPVFSDLLKETKARLAGETNLDKAWIGGRMSKPSIDKIGNWLVNKFIDADEDASPGPDQTHFSEEKAFVGPFSHYSAISSTVSSTSPSPTPSLSNAAPPPARASSSLSMRSTLVSSLPSMDRAASAMDGSRLTLRQPSPGPRTSSASAAMTTFAQSGSFVNPNGYGQYGATSQDGASDNSSSSGAWWGSNTYGDSATTPTVPSFVRPDGVISSSQSGGFISLMDNSHATGSSLQPSGSSRNREDMDDDLGLGNPKPKPQSPPVEEQKASPPKEEKKPEERPELKSASSSWFGRWWSSGTGAIKPGPVKANLGEESAFYYDKEKKRWVNKNALPGEEALPPPPPPSRPQSAAQLRAGTIPSTPPSPSLPLPRPASAMDSSGLGPPPSRPPTRARSNLIPESTESSPTPPRTTDSPGPPPSRPRSQATMRKNVRSRYVDVFQQSS